MRRFDRSACPKVIPTPTFGIIPLSGRLVKVYPEGGKNMRRKITAGLILRKDGRYQRNELIGDKPRQGVGRHPESPGRIRGAGAPAYHYPRFWAAVLCRVRRVPGNCGKDERGYPAQLHAQYPPRPGGSG